MNMSVEKKIVVGLGAVLVLLLGVGLVAYWSTTDLIGREVRVAQTHEVRETIERLLYLMEDIEDKQRLDLLTGEHQYLQSYPEAGHNIEEVLHKLTDMTRDSQIQQAQLLALRRLINLRFAQLKEGIDLRDSGKIDSEWADSPSTRGKDTMDKILMVLGEMQMQEQVLLSNWLKQAHGAASFTLSLVVGGTFLTMVLALGEEGGSYMTYRSADRPRVMCLPAERGKH